MSHILRAFRGKMPNLPSQAVGQPRLFADLELRLAHRPCRLGWLGRERLGISPSSDCPDRRACKPDDGEAEHVDTAMAIGDTRRPIPHIHSTAPYLTQASSWNAPWLPVSRSPDKLPCASIGGASYDCQHAREYIIAALMAGAMTHAPTPRSLNPLPPCH